MCRRELGLALRIKGRLDEAIAEFREAIRLNPLSHIAHHNLAGTLELQGRLAEAEAEVRETVRIKPIYAIHHGRLGMILFAQRKLVEAEIELREAVRLHQELPLYRFDLVNVLTAQGKTDEAITACREAIALKSNSAGSHTDLAHLIMCCPDTKLRDPGTAVELGKKAIEMAPQSEIAWQVLGWAQFSAGAFRESIESLQRSCRLHEAGMGDAAQWIVLALDHKQLASEAGLSRQERERNEMEFRRRYEQASKQIDSLWHVRPSHIVHRRIWDFRQEATELLGVNEARK
jgi:tetratricopeptide (TPR) repeat protein